MSYFKPNQNKLQSSKIIDGWCSGHKDVDIRFLEDLIRADEHEKYFKDGKIV